MFKKILYWINRLSERHTEQIQIKLKKTEFEIIKSGRVISAIPLAAVREITAFKRDLGTVDLVCFQIEVNRNDVSEQYVVNEEMEGFNELEALFEQNPNFNANWRELVIKPAFKEQRTIILTQ